MLQDGNLQVQTQSGDIHEPFLTIVGNHDRPGHANNYSHINVSSDPRQLYCASPHWAPKL